MIKSKRFLSAIALLVFSFSGYSQISFSPGFSAGLNVSNFRATDSAGNAAEPEPKSLTGFQAGVFAEIGILGFFSVVPGLEYSQRGATAVDTVNFKIVSSFDYLTVPVLLKFKYGALPIKPFLAVGPELGFLLSAKSKIHQVFMTRAIDTTFDVTDSGASTDFGLKIAGGAELDLGKIAPFIQASYYFGFLNIQKHSNGDFTTLNRLFNIQAGLRFKL